MDGAHRGETTHDEAMLLPLLVWLVEVAVVAVSPSGDDESDCADPIDATLGGRRLFGSKRSDEEAWVWLLEPAGVVGRLAVRKSCFEKARSEEA